ncbi:MAG TPA: SRPBCC family protein [Thermoanaerobaculia bacterium]|nr:SRPBCC family protein [Thermoanaerobaculia bacterium]
MRIEKSFVVQAPAAAVWEFLTDPARVASCLPGAAITGQLDPQTYGGTINVKVGPVTASYRGKMKFERLDAAAGEAEISASGQETRGKGAADMRMTSRVVARDAASTEVVIASDVNVVGALAQFGKGMIEDVSDQMFGKFSAAMRRQLETTPAAATAGSDASAVAASARSASPTTAAVASPATGAAAPTRVTASMPARAPASSASPAPASSVPRQTEEVLDLGAIGTAAARRAAVRALRNPVWWIALVLALHLLWHLWR